MKKLNLLLSGLTVLFINLSLGQAITVNGTALTAPSVGGAPASCTGDYKVRNNGIPAPSIAGNCITLTDGTAANGEGDLWVCAPLDLTNDFNLTFTANFGTNPNSGDGIAFVLNGNNNAPLGGVGGNIGYATAGNVLAVEFDTWPDADIACHHAEINYDGIDAGDNLSAPIPLKSCCGSVVDGSDYAICITWDASTQTLTATFDGNVVGTYTGDISALLGTSTPNWGFTSGCGAAGGQVQTACSVVMENQGATASNCTTCTPPTVTATPTSETICSGETTNLAISGSAGTDYCWQAVDNLNVNGETSTLTSETSASFTISETLTNGVPGTQTVTYNVYPISNSGCFGTPLALTVTVLDSGDPLCNCATPTLIITDPLTACFPSTVDLTDPNITAGSDPGTLSYWEDATATTPLASPGAVNTTGTYYIMLDIGGGCFTIEPVNVVVDNPPTASNPAPISVECAADVPVPNVSVVIDENDDITIPPTVTWLSDVSDNASCPETITRTYRVQDACANFVDVTQTITIIPVTNPTEIGGPVATASTVNCLANASAPALPVVQDVCGNVLTPAAPVVTDSPDPITCEGTRTYEYTYTDCAGNPFVWTYVYTIALTTSPAEVGGPVSTNGGTVECVADATAPATLPVIEDACGNVLTPSAPTNGGTYVDCEGTYTYVYDYVDCAGNP
ncbi:MAG: lectin-like domain-containing protein, partial [Crocinitomicaceae bacterium]